MNFHFPAYYFHEITTGKWTPLVNGYMERKLANVPEAMHSLVAPHELLTVTSGYGPSCINGWLLD
jgi:hypothetical protein